MLEYGTYAMEIFSKCLTSTGAIKNISRNIIFSLIPRNQTHEIVFRILTRVAMVTIYSDFFGLCRQQRKRRIQREENLENIQRRHTNIVEIEPNLSY